MKRNLIETLMGAIVLVIAVFFVFTTYQNSGIKKDYGYQLSGNFDKVDGITIGSDVRIGGIKVGTVVGQKLNPDTYRAQLIFGLRNEVRLPTDSTAEIVSDGLLGGKYVNIVPGAEIEMLRDGGEIEYTQSSVNLEQLIGKIAFGGTDSSKPAPKAEPRPEPKIEPKPEVKPEPKAEVKPVEKAPTPTPAPKKEEKKPAPAPVKPKATPVPVVTPSPTPAKVAPKPAITPVMTETKPVPTLAPKLEEFKPSGPPKPIEEPKPIETPKPNIDIDKGIKVEAPAPGNDDDDVKTEYEYPNASH